MRLRLKGLAESGPSEVRAEAGVTLNHLVRWTITRGPRGLERLGRARPARSGEPSAANAHFGGRLIAELVARVELLAPSGEVTIVPRDDMEFGTTAAASWRRGDRRGRGVHGCRPASPRTRCATGPAIARAAQALAAAERAQRGMRVPESRTGRDPVPAGIPPSAGALIDRAGSRAAGSVARSCSPAARRPLSWPSLAPRAADVGPDRALPARRTGIIRGRSQEEIRYLGDFGEI